TCVGGTCGCLAIGSNCSSGSECCVGLACVSGHCGQPVDAGSCTLDPGGTPCSQCIVGNCCQETMTCLNDANCAASMACFQRCAVNGGTATQCAQMCCTTSSCKTWTSCVASHCTATCL